MSIEDQWNAIDNGASAPESTQELPPQFTLLEVYSIKATQDTGYYLCDIKYADYTGAVYDHMTFGSVPGDMQGLGPTVRQWIADHPEFPIEPYVPPSMDDIRATWPRLLRLDWRTKAKAIGITTVVVNNYLNGIEDPDHQDDMMMYWSDTPDIGRLDTFVKEVGAFANKTPEQIDTIWVPA